MNNKFTSFSFSLWVLFHCWCIFKLVINSIHITKYTLQKTSPSPDPCSSRGGGCHFNKVTTNAVRCTSKMVVPGRKIGDPSKVSLLASTSLASSLDWSFCVTSRTLSDIPKSLSMTLRNPNNHAFTVFILDILWLFHQAHLGINIEEILMTCSRMKQRKLSPDRHGVKY